MAVEIEGAMEVQNGLNSRISAITPSLTLGISSKAKAMAAAGDQVCNFAAGEPDFDTPAHIKQAAAQALAEGKTKYAPTPGLPDLRAAISEKLKHANGLDYAPAQVVVSNGGKHTLYNVFMTVCRDGDEVVLPAPYWLSYPEMIRMAGGVPVIVACSEAAGFKMSPEAFEAAITDKTKAVVLNSPSNPIGVVYTRDELEQLAEVALRHGLYVVSDEMYEPMVYDGVEHVSVGSFSAELQATTITVNGFSKAYSMTGWRLGYMGAPADIAKAVISLQSHSTSGPNTFAQYGGLAALTGSQDCVAEMVKAFDQRRQLLYRRLDAIDGVTCVRPQGAFYMLPNIASFGLDTVTFCDRLLEETKTAMVPGAAFEADGNVRISYACSEDVINEGMDRLETFVKAL